MRILIFIHTLLHTSHTRPAHAHTQANVMNTVITDQRHMHAHKRMLTSACAHIQQMKKTQERDEEENGV